MIIDPWTSWTWNPSIKIYQCGFTRWSLFKIRGLLLNPATTTRRRLPNSQWTNYHPSFEIISLFVNFFLHFSLNHREYLISVWKFHISIERKLKFHKSLVLAQISKYKLIKTIWSRRDVFGGPNTINAFSERR